MISFSHKTSLGLKLFKVLKHIRTRSIFWLLCQLWSIPLSKTWWQQMISTAENLIRWSQRFELADVLLQLQETYEPLRFARQTFILPMFSHGYFVFFSSLIAFMVRWRLQDLANFLVETQDMQELAGRSCLVFLFSSVFVPHFFSQ